MASGALKQEKNAIFKTPKASPTSISGSQACAVMSMLERVSVCDTHSLRPPCKILKSVFVKHEIPVYNPENWRLC